MCESNIHNLNTNIIKEHSVTVCFFQNYVVVFCFWIGRNCIWSRDGSEYMGSVSHIDSTLGSKMDCLPWTSVLESGHVNASLTLTNLPSDWENKYCRNPSNKVANSPYCFYQSANAVIQKGYCKIPSCGEIYSYTAIQWTNNILSQSHVANIYILLKH